MQCIELIREVPKEVPNTDGCSGEEVGRGQNMFFFVGG